MKALLRIFAASLFVGMTVTSTARANSDPEFVSATLQGDFDRLHLLATTGNSLESGTKNIFTVATGNGDFRDFYGLPAPITFYSKNENVDRLFTAVGSLDSRFLNSELTAEAFGKAIFNRQFYLAKKLVLAGFDPDRLIPTYGRHGGEPYGVEHPGLPRMETFYSLNVGRIGPDFYDIYAFPEVLTSDALDLVIEVESRRIQVSPEQRERWVAAFASALVSGRTGDATLEQFERAYALFSKSPRIAELGDCEIIATIEAAHRSGVFLREFKRLLGEGLDPNGMAKGGCSFSGFGVGKNATFIGIALKGYANAQRLRISNLEPLRLLVSHGADLNAVCSRSSANPYCPSPNDGRGNWNAGLLPAFLFYSEKAGLEYIDLTLLDFYLKQKVDLRAPMALDFDDVNGDLLDRLLLSLGFEHAVEAIRILVENGQFTGSISDRMATAFRYARGYESVRFPTRLRLPYSPEDLTHHLVALRNALPAPQARMTSVGMAGALVNEWEETLLRELFLSSGASDVRRFRLEISAEVKKQIASMRAECSNDGHINPVLRRTIRRECRQQTDALQRKALIQLGKL